MNANPILSSMFLLVVLAAVYVAFVGLTKVFDRRRLHLLSEKMKSPGFGWLHMLLILALVASFYTGSLAQPVRVTYTRNKEYNWNHVSVKLTNRKHILRGKLISVTDDLLVIKTEYGYKKEPLRISYSEIAYVGIHRKGSGAIGALIGGLAGGVIGYAVSYTPYEETNNIGANIRNSFKEVGAGLGLVIGAGIGAGIGASIGAGIASSNKRHPIDGDKVKFELLLGKIAKPLQK